MDWERAARRGDPDSVPGQVYTRLRRLIAARTATAALGAGQSLRALPLGDPALLGIARGTDFVAAYNFSAQAVAVERAALGNGDWQAIADGGRDDAALQEWDGLLPAYGLRWWRRG
jgi:amylosucrase